MAAVASNYPVADVRCLCAEQIQITEARETKNRGSRMILFVVAGVLRRPLVLILASHGHVTPEFYSHFLKV